MKKLFTVKNKQDNKKDRFNMSKCIPEIKAQKNFNPLKAYEDRVRNILSLEENGKIVGEIIDGPGTSLKILKNHFHCHSKQLIILVHGSGLNEFSWTPVLEPLENEGINALTFAWRGHSKSLPFNKEELSKAGMGLMDFVKDAKAVIEKYQKDLNINSKQILLVGHSYGTIINTFLARSKNYKAILNFCAAYPNVEYFKERGVNIDNRKELTESMSKLWGFSSQEWIKKTLDDANKNKVFKNYKEMGTQDWYLSQLLNIEIPINYNGILKMILGPSSRKAAAEALLTPPFLPKRSEINAPMHFFAASEDRLVPKHTIEKLAESWNSSYNELDGPHAGTYTPCLDQYIDAICKYVS